MSHIENLSMEGMFRVSFSKEIKTRGLQMDYVVNKNTFYPFSTGTFHFPRAGDNFFRFSLRLRVYAFLYAFFTFFFTLFPQILGDH